MHKQFKPDYTPYEMFKESIFANCGGYWRPIYSRIAGREIKDDYKQFDWEDLGHAPLKQPVGRFATNLPLDKLITEPNASKNKYGVAASASLEEWEDNNWIHYAGNDSDYRGWVGWYCLYYSGRRVPEIDSIQIKRWLNVKARFGSIKNKTPKIKQVLLQWAIKC